jgi:zinc protease
VDDLQAFLATWYVPENATLAIAGRFDRDVAMVAIERYFGPLVSTPPPPRPVVDPGSAAGVRLIVVAPVPHGQVQMAWRTPAFGDPDDLALDVAAQLLAGMGNERLQRSLVASELAIGAGAREASRRAASVFTIWATVAPHANSDAVVVAIEHSLDALANVPEGEVARARRNLHDGAVLSLATTWGRASRLTALAREGVLPGPRFDWGLGIYDRVTSQDVRRAAARWLGPSHRVDALVRISSHAPMRGVLARREVR